MDADGGFIFKDGGFMKLGHTTGTCAAAASKAAAVMLFSQNSADSVKIMTPKGKELILAVEDPRFGVTDASCAVRKDGGDDADCTHGTLIYSRVSFSEHGINIDGGEGIGRVTRNGLDQPVGNAAINHVPREMISKAVKEICCEYDYGGGIDVIIGAPEGRELAKRTFNPRLGIVDGISIIGTSGIVEPMSETAMIDAMRTETKVKMASGAKHLLFVPGNYGKDFLRLFPHISDTDSIKCSNYVGESLDAAAEFGAESVLLAGNIGKLVKIAGGMMNTHSKYGDCRMDILASCSVAAGLDISYIRRILNCVTADDALDVMHETGSVKNVMDVMIKRIAFNLDNRVRGKIETGAMVFSAKYGRLCETDNAENMIKRIGVSR